MSKREFSTYQDFCRAVAERGLVVETEPTRYEGMHESDAYQPCFAMTPGDEDLSRAFGDYANSEDGTEGGYGVLFETQDEYNAWIHNDDGEEPLRPFTKSDWYGYAGATPFPNGEPPRIGSIAGWTIVVGGEEDSAGTLVEINCENEVWQRLFPNTEDAMLVANTILTRREPPTTQEGVRMFCWAANFKRIN